MTTIHCPACSAQLAVVLPSALPEEERPTPHVDLLELLQRTRVQTVQSAARVMFDTERPTRAQQMRTRRKLDRMVYDGKATLRTGRDGAHQYVPTEPHQYVPTA